MRSVKIFALRCFLPFLLMLLLANAGHGQYVQTPRPNVPINADCNGYLETLPQDYATSNQTYPLLIFLEGIQEAGSGSFDDLQKLYNNGPPYLIKNGLFPSSFSVNSQSFRFIIFTPQFSIPLWQRYPSPAEINSIIDYAVQHYRVDQSRIYLTGLSTGGGTVFYYAGASSTYANRLAAIIPFASTYGTSDSTEFTRAAVEPRARTMAAANLPVWAFHNRYDSGVPDSITLNYVAYMNESPTPNPPAKATIFDASGHECWYNAYNSAYSENNMTIYQWMLQYSRGSAPPPVNKPPTVSAGANQTITLPVNSVTLNGTASDPDGTIASYSWSKISGANVSFGSPSAASTTVNNLTQGSYVFRLTVTDNNGATASSDVTVTVNAAPNQPPVANAGADQTITLPTNSVTVSGSGSDADGSIASYQWTKVSGPAQGSITNASAASTIIIGLVQGVYTFRLTVTDNNGATASDDMIVTVNAAANQTPAANAGVDQTITLPNNSVQLNGSGSDPDGTIVSYQWTKISGPTQGSFNNGSIANPTVSGLVQGSYTFRLTVTDNGGATASDDMIVTVNAATNQPPVVSAGSNQTITLPASSVTLNGSATDADGTIVSYSWSKVSGGNVSFSTTTAPSTTVSGLAQGSYVFRLTATDNSGASGSADVTVTVNGSSTGSVTRIEAENWSAMSGVSTESAWGDPQGGGLIVGWIDPGDWMDYVFNAPVAGTYTVNFRIATPLNGAQFQMRNASGTVLTTVSVPNTGAWQTWQTISTTVSLPAGVQTIRLYASTANGWNINWLEFVSGTTGVMAASATTIMTQEQAAALFEVFPNPVTNQFTMYFNNSYKGDIKVQLIGMNGAVQKEWIFQKQTTIAQMPLSITKLPAGSYLIKASANKWVQSKQILKQ